MGTSSFRLKRDDRVGFTAQTHDGKIHRIITEEMLPRVAATNRVAVQGQGLPYFVFNRINPPFGRRCSCFLVEGSASSQCYACFGTGSVGGFAKHGTMLDVFDVTHPCINAVNVLPYYADDTRPIKFILVPNATFGYVESRMHLRPNIGVLDDFSVLHFPDVTPDVQYFIKSPIDSEFVHLTDDKQVQSRLGHRYLDFRVELRRPSPKSKSPRFAFISLRYMVKRQLTVLCDVPKTERRKELAELGLDDDWQRQSFWITDEIRQVNPGDFMVSINGADRWKITTATETAPTNYVTSWDVNTRLIMERSEPFALVPIGQLGPDDLKSDQRSGRP